MKNYEMVDGTDSKDSYLLLARRNGMDISLKPGSLRDTREVTGHALLPVKLRSAPTAPHVKVDTTVIDLQWAKPINTPADVLPLIKWDASSSLRASTTLAIGVKGQLSNVNHVPALIESLEDPTVGQKIAKHVFTVLGEGPLVLTEEQVAEWLNDFYAERAAELRQKLSMKQAVEEKVAEGMGTVGLFSELLQKAYAATPQGQNKKPSKHAKEDVDDDPEDDEDEDDEDY